MSDWEKKIASISRPEWEAKMAHIRATNKFFINLQEGTDENDRFREDQQDRENFLASEIDKSYTRGE